MAIEPSRREQGQGRHLGPVAEEKIELARICAVKRHFAAAARFSEEAFTAKPALAENLRVNNRYNAACMAVLAAAGQGGDTATLDETALE